MRLIRRASRLVALALTVVLASVSLASGESACMSVGTASMAMSGHAMSPHHATTIAAPGARAPQSPAAPCHLPTAPNACVGMATCSTVALPSIAAAATAPRPLSERAVHRTIALAPGEARAPELPPPRA